MADPAGRNDPADDLVLVGEITGVWGVQGWVKLHSFTSPLDNLIDYGPWVVAGAPGLSVEQGGWQGKRMVAQLARDGAVIEDRDTAAALVGKQIHVSRDCFSAAEPGEYYWADLIGLAVTNTEGEALGVVSGLQETAAHDVLVVEQAETGAERLIPFVQPDIVRSVALNGDTGDTGDGEMVVEWPADFLPNAKADDTGRNA